MTHIARFAVAAVAAFACGGACAHDPDGDGRLVAPRSPLCDAPRGDVSMMQTPAGPRDLYGFGIAIAPPETCGTSSYIAVRGEGRRRFFGGRPPAGDPSVCVGRPAADDPCTLVSVNDFGHEVFFRMRDAGVDGNGVGMGACGRLGDLPAWNFGVGVSDWAHADTALGIVQDRLRAWRVGDVFGVSVIPISCGIELEGSR